MNPEGLDLIVVSSAKCVVCLKDKTDKKVIALFVKEEDRDLLPFEYLGAPICLVCKNLSKDLDAAMCWANLLTLLEGQHNLIDMRSIDTGSSRGS